MDKKLRLILEIVGILISIISLLLLIMDEKYVAAGLVLLLCVTLIVHAIRSLNSTPQKWISVHYYYEIVDVGAEKVKVQKVNKFIVREGNMRVLEDRQFSATGNIRFIGSNLGEIEEFGEGGDRGVRTILPAALQKGAEVEHIIEYEGINSLSQKKESVTTDVVNKCYQVGLHVRFHQERLPISVNARVRRWSKSLDITQQHLTKLDRQWSVVVNNPKLGDRIILEWEW